MIVSNVTTLIALLWFISEASITFLNIQIWPLCSSSFTLVLNSTLSTFVTVGGDVLVNRGWYVGRVYHFRYTTFYLKCPSCIQKKAWKHSDRLVWGSLLWNYNHHELWQTEHQELDSEPCHLQNHNEFTILLYHSF